MWPTNFISSLENPAIVGFSNYIWNFNYNKTLAKAIKSRWPHALTIFGGPEVPDNIDSFYQSNPFVDIGVHQEAEYTFLELLLSNLTKSLDLSHIPGISYFHPRDGAVKNPSVGRINSLEELPSPYLTGVFDDIIKNYDSQWAATFETNRGCPFKCHFCDWGSLTFSKVKRFPMERVNAELEWFSDNKIEYVFFADANFGTFKSRDSDIADKLIATASTTGYPRTVNIQWAKNSNKNIVDLAKRIGSVQKGITLSVQSMSNEVLTAIERKNMAISNLSEILAECNRASIPTYTELILGLPLESFPSWKNGWYELLDLGQHCSIEVWIAQTLENSLLNDPEERERYGIKTIRAKGYFFGISDSADTVENKIPEEIALVTETNTLGFDSLTESYMFSWMMINFHCFGWTQLVSRFLRVQNIADYNCFYSSLFDYIRNSEQSGMLFQQYNITHQRITEYLTSGDIDVNLEHELGFEMKFVGHNLIYASQMVFRNFYQSVLDDLTPFFNEHTKDVDPQIRDDLIYSQGRWMIVPGRVYPETLVVGSNLFEHILHKSDLQCDKHTYSLDLIPEVRAYVPDIEAQKLTDFLNMFWMKRRWGPGTAETKLLSS